MFHSGFPTYEVHVQTITGEILDEKFEATVQPELIIIKADDHVKIEEGFIVIVDKEDKSKEKYKIEKSEYYSANFTGFSAHYQLTVSKIQDFRSMKKKDICGFIYEHINNRHYEEGNFLDVDHSLKISFCDKHLGNNYGDVLDVLEEMTGNGFFVKDGRNFIIQDKVLEFASSYKSKPQFKDTSNVNITNNLISGNGVISNGNNNSISVSSSSSSLEFLDKLNELVRSLKNDELSKKFDELASAVKAKNDKKLIIENFGNFMVSLVNVLSSCKEFTPYLVQCITYISSLFS